MLILPVILISAKSIFASDKLDDEISPYAVQAININEKLKTCKPAKLQGAESQTTIHGMKKGLCSFTIVNTSSSSITNRQTGEKLDISSCDYNVPIDAVKKYAIDNIKLIKSLYQIDNIALSNSEILEIGNNEFEFVKKYCN